MQVAITRQVETFHNAALICQDDENMNLKANLFDQGHTDSIIHFLRFDVYNGKTYLDDDGPFDKRSYNHKIGINVTYKHVAFQNRSFNIFLCEAEKSTEISQIKNHDFTKVSSMKEATMSIFIVSTFSASCLIEQIRNGQREREHLELSWASWLHSRVSGHRKRVPLDFIARIYFLLNIPITL